jgi:hypothetical protein
MLTVDELRGMWQEAKDECAGKRPTYFQWLLRGAEYLIPTEDDSLPILIRCRCCGTLQVTVLGPEDSLPDHNISIRSHVKAPCGYCGTSAMVPGWTVAAVRRQYAAGQPCGVGGRA